MKTGNEQVMSFLHQRSQRLEGLIKKCLRLAVEDPLFASDYRREAYKYLIQLTDVGMLARKYKAA